jgi:hypothetical protein
LPDFRFYALYDKVYRKDVLSYAYACCKANGGVTGVDNQTFEDIEAYGAERWLDELRRTFSISCFLVSGGRTALSKTPYSSSPERDQVNAMFFFQLMTQAECRGFDPGLLLHGISHLA